MTKSFLKAVVVSVLFLLVVSAVAYVAYTINIPEAEAAGSCGGCGGGGDDGGDGGGYGDGPDPIYPIIPSCILTANPTTIIKGDSATLTWITANADNVTLLRPFGTVAVGKNSNLKVTPQQTFTYVLTVTSGFNKVTCKATVVVKTPPPTTPAPTCDMSANPTVINRGEQSTLTWTTQNATTVTLKRPSGTGEVNAKDSIKVSPQNTYTFVLTATGDGGTVTCSKTVTVVPPVVDVPVCESFSASPRVIDRGDNSTLIWETRNASSVWINNGVGSVALDGSISVSPRYTTTYTLTVSGNGGTVSCSTTIIVEDDEEFTCENNVDFYASPRYIDEGEETTLYWSTTGVKSLYFNRISSTRLDGSADVSPDSDTTYTMYASNGSRTISCSVTVEVDEDNGGGGGSTRPTCDLDASDTKVNRGDAVKLTWKTRNAYDVILEDNYGRTYIDSNGKRSSVVDDLLDDSLTVYPTRDTTYTLIAERGSYERKCSVKIYVDEDDIIVKEIRDQKPIVTGISLVEVPYTGFEAGPFMTLVFYMLLVLWALYLAYVLVIRRTPAFANDATDVSSNSDIGQYTQSPSFVTTTATPDFHVPAATPVAPTGVQYGYDGVVNDEAATEVENRAHAAHVLFSGEAMRYFMETTNSDNRMSALDKVLDEAKASYPAEDGWVVLNEERLAQTCTTCFANKTATSDSSFTPATGTVGNSSLAEAIVTGNIVAAYQMIGNRPMIALADTAADLDALYRAKQGADVTVSKLLAHSDVKTEQLHNAIAALTGALDGTYTDEAEAVKMAILKSIKAIHG